MISPDAGRVRERERHAAIDAREENQLPAPGAALPSRRGYFPIITIVNDPGIAGA